MLGWVCIIVFLKLAGLLYYWNYKISGVTCVTVNSVEPIPLLKKWIVTALSGLFCLSGRKKPFPPSLERAVKKLYDYVRLFQFLRKVTWVAVAWPSLFAEFRNWIMDPSRCRRWTVRNSNTIWMWCSLVCFFFSTLFEVRSLWSRSWEC